MPPLACTTLRPAVSMKPFNSMARLMAIPGGSGQEKAVADAITKHLLAAGAPAAAIRTDRANRRTPLAGDVGNLMLKLPGVPVAARQARARLLMAHMDTVPLCVGDRASSRRRLYPLRQSQHRRWRRRSARGAAVILAAALAILRHKLPHPPLTFLWTVQEEIGLYGARFADLPLLGGPKLAFNWDGGAVERVTIGATGGYRMEIIVRGLAGSTRASTRSSASAPHRHRRTGGRRTCQSGGWHGEVLRGRRRGTNQHRLDRRG